jgi:hypothetical protein
MNLRLTIFVCRTIGAVRTTGPVIPLFSPAPIQSEADDADDEQQCDEFLDSNCHIEFIVWWRQSTA